jgi:uncharacterized protein
MKKLKEAHVPYNSGWAGELKNGQVIRIIATTTVDFVCMRLDNLKERFDQARTKVYNMKIFVTTGDKLMGRNNQHMMTIVENTNHEGTLRDYYHRDYRDEEIPDHGCYENLSRALAPYGIAPEDIPNPFNLNQHMKIDGVTGRMDHTTVRPKPGSYVDLRAEMDLLVAFSACPDMPVGGKPVDLLIYEP